MMKKPLSHSALLGAYWRSEERWRASGLLALVILLEMGTVYAAVGISNWQKNFFDALADYQRSAIAPLLLTLALLMGIAVLSKTFSIWFTQLLTLRWRSWLVDVFLEKWLRQRIYYHLENDATADNPDQRIAEDLRQMAEKSLELLLGLLTNIANAVSFSVILWGLSGTLSLTLLGHEFQVPGYMLWVGIAYALLGSWLMEKIGRPLVGLSYQQQRCEADFRYQLMRIRESAEQIAFYRGESEENRRLRTAFSAVQQNWRGLMVYSKRVAFTETLYIEAGSFVPYLFTIPRYFARQLTIGGVMQMGIGFARLRTALSWFLFNYKDLALLRAVLRRLCEFDDLLRQQERGDIVITSSADNALRTRGLCLRLPDGAPLAAIPDTEIRPGERWMICGGSGGGKSTLLRALAGLWPYGSGSVAFPAGSYLFLPQKSYLPSGTLREALSYPGKTLDSERCRDALTQVRLEHYIPCLEQTAQWDKRLSPGEQQRLAFARVLLQRPDSVFLDEATSALDRENEDNLYRLLRETLPDATVISVTHHPHLTHWHSHTLRITPAKEESNAATSDEPQSAISSLPGNAAETITVSRAH
ncbi:ABC transporter permease [Brenneria roseae subsp. roseae]|uniref:ABC transporter ATP-binding protein/permease n=1 Tax=Brenneria roseae TaxID=1509241 RepID=UPI000D61C509|nr:ABC transporter ATP-binding protein/permease [Brenneria roseae]PWC17513.1 ABC transporter permease [Brenneria roseae subsp. roseae]